MKFFELFIGFRYLKAKKSQGFISFNTLLSIFIVFIGVFILILVISVMNGFQAQIKDKILDVDAHITVNELLGDRGGAGIRKYRDVAKKVSAIEGIVSSEPFIQGQGLFRFRANINPVVIRGMGEQGRVPKDVKKFITEGASSFGKNGGVYVGSEMALSNNINIGDRIELIVPKGRLTAIEGITPGIGSYEVLGYFKTGYYDFDTKLVLMSLPESQRLFEVGDIANGIGVKINDVFQMDRLASKIQSELHYEYATTTAEEKNQNLFYALKLEKLIMTVILFLVIVSAGFSIMGTLVMVVMDKRKAIGILKAMGASPRSIMIIFVLEGFLIGIIGALSGVILGLAASLNLEAIIRWVELKINSIMAFIYHAFDLGIYMKISIVPTNVYYIDSIPTLVKPEFVVFIAVFAVFLSTLAAVFPAWQASRMSPVETIRYE